jgi:RNA polymerase sigma factor (sigma-70 family)
VKAATEKPETKGPLTRFATSRWSLIRQRFSGDEQAEVDPGFAQLCQIYWRPIFTFIYRRGYSAADAQDLTQDFFLMIMERNFLQSADPKRGRFRSLLLRSLKNFLIDAAAKRRLDKRGGEVQFVSWEKWMADAPAQLSLSAAALDSSAPETLFDAGWAAAIAEEALRRLRLECESKGRRRVYAVLHPHLAAERSEICYEKLSGELGVPELAVKSLLHHFRTRYRALLREEVAKTVETEANIDDEIRYLCATLSAESTKSP